MRRLLAALCAILILCSLSLPALALTPSGDYYVYDETGSLSRETIDKVVIANGALERECGAQLVVVFISYFGGVDSDVYATRLFNEWDVDNNGMLLAVSPKEKRGWLATGSGIAGRFTDSDADSYLNKYFWDDFDAGRYDKAVTKLVDKLCGWYEKEFKVSLSLSSGGYDDYEDDTGDDGSALMFLVLIIFLVIYLNGMRRRRSHYIGGMNYGLWYLLQSGLLSSRFTDEPYHHTPYSGGYHSSGHHTSSGGFSSGGRGFGGGGRASGGGGGRR